MAKATANINIKDWFDKPYGENQMRLRRQLIPDHRSILDTLGARCSACKGTTVCSSCQGTGSHDYVCDFCFFDSGDACVECGDTGVLFETCTECNGSGLCSECEGEGEGEAA